MQSDLDQLFSTEWEQLQTEGALENATSLTSAETRVAELQKYKK